MATKKMRAEEFGTIDEFRACVDGIAEHIIQQRKIELERDKKVQKILDEYGPQVKEHEDAATALLARADAYAKTHRDEVFPKGTKTSETNLCTFFLRIGTPALKALNSKWKDADIVAAAKNDPAWRQFVRVKESLDKDGIKDAGFSDADLAYHGLRITQTERLTVEPKVNSL